MNAFAPTAEEIPTLVFRRIEAAELARLREDPDAAASMNGFTHDIGAGCGALRRGGRRITMPCARHRRAFAPDPSSGRTRTMRTDTQTELEAAAFRRLRDHLRAHPEVQNIELMSLAGFCRNCLARWYREEAAARGIALDDAAAREIVYGMPYPEWKAKYQREATPEQDVAFKARHPAK